MWTSQETLIYIVSTDVQVEEFVIGVVLWKHCGVAVSISLLTSGVSDSMHGLLSLYEAYPPLPDKGSDMNSLMKCKLGETTDRCLTRKSSVICKGIDKNNVMAFWHT